MKKQATATTKTKIFPQKHAKGLELFIGIHGGEFLLNYITSAFQSGLRFSIKHYAHWALADIAVLCSKVDLGLEVT
jgi:hypothetical protein